MLKLVTSLGGDDIKLIQTSDLVLDNSMIKRFIPFLEGGLAYITSEPRKFREGVKGSSDAHTRGYRCLEYHAVHRLLGDRVDMTNLKHIAFSTAMATTWAKGQQVVFNKFCHLLTEMFKNSKELQIDWRSYLHKEGFYMQKAPHLLKEGLLLPEEVEFLNAEVIGIRKRMQATIAGVFKSGNDPKAALDTLKQIGNGVTHSDQFTKIRHKKDNRARLLTITIKKGKREETQLLPGATLIEKMKGIDNLSLSTLCAALWSPLCSVGLSSFTQWVCLKLEIDRRVGAAAASSTAVPKTLDERLASLEGEGPTDVEFSIYLLILSNFQVTDAASVNMNTKLVAI
jgi:hypothetical protein